MKKIHHAKRFLVLTPSVTFVELVSRITVRKDTDPWYIQQLLRYKDELSAEVTVK